MNVLIDWGYEPEDVEVKVSELLVATSDQCDEFVDSSIQEVLRLLREKMNMDVVFVSEFTEGQRVFRYVDTSPGGDVVAVGGADALEASWCQRVVDGRLPNYIHDTSKLPASVELVKKLPFSIGTHISTPIVLRNGEIYGTLCCFSFSTTGEAKPADLQRLRMTANLAARKLEQRPVRSPVRTPHAGDMDVTH